MIVYLASPGNQMHAAALEEMPVLLSFALRSRWVEDYQQSFGRILIDSGAFTELNSGKKVDVGEYREWSERWRERADAIAGVDDIRGDWRRSLENYEAVPWGFPTFHDSDPFGLLDDLVAIATERGQWIGIGLVPPREGKERFVRETCDRIPDGIHVHGWALRRYTHIPRLDSVDSTNWMRDSWKVLNRPECAHLTPAEAVEIVVKRYKRWKRVVVENDAGLFGKNEE